MEKIQAEKPTILENEKKQLENLQLELQQLEPLKLKFQDTETEFAKVQEELIQAYNMNHTVLGEIDSLLPTIIKSTDKLESAANLNRLSKVHSSTDYKVTLYRMCILTTRNCRFD